MTEITLYNTATRTKERLVPLIPGQVRMYVCGPTVYDRAHIGNARPAVVFDVLDRLLRHVYGAENVTHVRNFTDVDDKINARAAESLRPGETLEQAVRRITDETIGWYHEDMGALGVQRPDHEPRATDMIAPMVAMIETLIAKGHAYAAEGHVLFAVDSYADYGRLSGRSVEDMIAGARVEVAPYKKNPMDFVLWKPSDAETPGWDSPWGRGRPGWHIECSAMAKDLLGETFDIHGGGIDLAFPHHENELAQSCAAHGRDDTMASIWMHNEMIRVEGQKMSKSLGNFFTVRDLLDKGVPAEVIRFVLLSTHYRSPLDWTEKRVREASQTLRRWRDLIGDTPADGAGAAPVAAALADDLNTPKAVAELHELAKRDGGAGLLRAGGALLGFFGDEAADLAGPDLSVDTALKSRIDSLIEMRLTARAEKDFARADAIRDALTRAGVEVMDRPGGSDWRFGLSTDLSQLEGFE